MAQIAENAVAALTRGTDGHLRRDQRIKIKFRAVHLAGKQNATRVQRLKLAAHAGHQAGIGGKGRTVRGGIRLQNAGVIGHVGPRAVVPFGIGKSA